MGAQTISNKDPKGYYKRLGVGPAASADDIKSAFRHLAKTSHPDTNSAADAKQKFQELNEAYEVLSDPERRASYDASAFQESAQETKSEPPEPIVCSKCGKITAQPRYAVYRYVVSFVLATTRNAIQGIFCADCGKRAALRASAISAVAGWWGIPWGPIYTIIEIIKNAMGGFEPPGSRERLLLRNAFAFLAKGNVRLSYALASEARLASDREISLAAFRLMDLLKSEGVEETPPLINKWNSPTQPLAHFALLATLPLLLAALVVFLPSQNTPTYAAPNWTVTSPPPDQYTAASPPPAPTESGADANATSASGVQEQAQTPALPICSTPPNSGDVLTNNTSWSSEENALEIKNGSGGNAIIKIRDASTGEVLVSFFVANDQTAQYSFIKDGTYRIQYAFGDALDETCTKFASIKGAGEFPDSETFTTEYRDAQIVHHVLSYTLYGIPGGNVQPNAIDADAFNRP